MFYMLKVIIEEIQYTERIENWDIGKGVYQFFIYTQPWWQLTTGCVAWLLIHFTPQACFLT